MKILAELSDMDIGINTVKSDVKYQVRKASRAILINESNQIAILYVSKKNYHKLPGGGMEQDENMLEALKREVLEEVGVEIKVQSEVGVVIEYRNSHEFMQISYCFIAHAHNKIGIPSFTDEEVSNGFILKWVDIENAIGILDNDKPADYVGQFISKRDSIFLTKAKELIMNNE